MHPLFSSIFRVYHKTAVYDLLEQKNRREELVVCVVCDADYLQDIVNQDWYDRRGYKVILVQKNGYMAPGIEGKLYPVDLVYMVKDLK